MVKVGSSTFGPYCLLSLNSCVGQTRKLLTVNKADVELVGQLLCAASE
jgi:hypothetical protein